MTLDIAHENMIANRTYHSAEIDFKIADVASRTEPQKVLICSPEYFNIVDVKNIHMKGNIGGVDLHLAQRQWDNLKSAYTELKRRGILEDVLVIPGAEGLEDMVFAANQSFPWILKNEKVAVMSKMRYPSRQREVPFFKKFYDALGYKTIEIKADLFEGMGDLISHYGKNLLYGGYGYRSSPEAYRELSVLLQVPVALLELKDDRFYHLDTCFLPVDEETVFLTKVAFQKEGLDTINKLFKNVVDIPLHEAEEFFALNAHCINDQKTEKKAAVLQSGTKVMKEQLKAHGYEVIELDTTEFIKSGGSVFCMKMMVY